VFLSDQVLAILHNESGAESQIHTSSNDILLVERFDLGIRYILRNEGIESIFGGLLDGSSSGCVK
jgi:hypothetical protein